MVEPGGLLRVNEVREAPRSAWSSSSGGAEAPSASASASSTLTPVPPPQPTLRAGPWSRRGHG